MASTSTLSTARTGVVLHRWVGSGVVAAAAVGYVWWRAVGVPANVFAWLVWLLEAVMVAASVAGVVWHQKSRTVPRSPPRPADCGVVSVPEAATALQLRTTLVAARTAGLCAPTVLLPPHREDLVAATEGLCAEVVFDSAPTSVTAAVAAARGEVAWWVWAPDLPTVELGRLELGASPVLQGAVSPADGCDDLRLSGSSVDVLSAVRRIAAGSALWSGSGSVFDPVALWAAPGCGTAKAPAVVPAAGAVTARRTDDCPEAAARSGAACWWRAGLATVPVLWWVPLLWLAVAAVAAGEPLVSGPALGAAALVVWLRSRADGVTLADQLRVSSVLWAAVTSPAALVVPVVVLALAVPVRWVSFGAAGDGPSLVLTTLLAVSVLAVRPPARRERRGVRRVAVQLPAAVDGCAVRTVDVSPSGVALHCRFPLREGRPVQLRVDVPTVSGPVEVSLPAATVHCVRTGDGFVAGVRFCVAPTDPRLDPFIELLVTSPAGEPVAAAPTAHLGAAH